MLAKLGLQNVEIIESNAQFDILHVKDSHNLIKAAGYLKFTHSSTDKSEGIYFRGERKIYESLSPTLFRSVKNQNAKQRKTSLLNNALKEFNNKCPIFAKFGQYAHEPLLQHYGISTSWLDVVDNIWIALWFACHQAKSAGENNEYLHFEKRTPKPNEYAYILLIGADIDRRHSGKPGWFHGENTELIDLRMATPSVFLRPHAQHGLLFRCRGVSHQRPHDYRQQIRGIIRVDLNDALDWLGQGKIVGTHALFPPAYYDIGYRILLECGAKYDNDLGSIALIGS